MGGRHQGRGHSDGEALDHVTALIGGTTSLCGDRSRIMDIFRGRHGRRLDRSGGGGGPAGRPRSAGALPTSSHGLAGASRRDRSNNLLLGRSSAPTASSFRSSGGEMRLDVRGAKKRPSRARGKTARDGRDGGGHAFFFDRAVTAMSYGAVKGRDTDSGLAAGDARFWSPMASWPLHRSKRSLARVGSLP